MWNLCVVRDLHIPLPLFISGKSDGILWEKNMYRLHSRRKQSYLETVEDNFAPQLSKAVCYIFVQFPTKREQHGCQIRCFSLNHGLLIPDSLHCHANSRTNDIGAEAMARLLCTRDLYLSDELADPWRSSLVLCAMGILQMLHKTEGNTGGCGCPTATVLTRFPSVVSNDCCLNYSGSTFNQVPWSAFIFKSNLQVLDLTNCNISQIDHSDVGDASTLLRKLYLGQNRLTSLPADFLAKAYHLEVLDLEMNFLKDLPVRFLQNSEQMQMLNLGWNQLSFLPGSVLKPSLQHLKLLENPWACTCSLLENLQGAQHDNSSSLQDLVGNLTCASPQSLAGWTVWSLKSGDVCHLANLTPLFILLPMLLLLSLVFCWCCGRKKKRKETSSFSPARKRSNNSQCNAWWPHAKLPTGESAVSVDRKDVILRNHLMLQPSSHLLGSTRDIYEEVEIKLGSVDSLAPPPSTCSTEGTAGKQDLDAVSVTDVMKDSADREKAYMIQSTEYYSLVPGIEMEDSDHGEYESVDLS